jgi:hypothetical protein
MMAVVLGMVDAQAQIKVLVMMVLVHIPLISVMAQVNLETPVGVLTVVMDLMKVKDAVQTVLMIQIILVQHVQIYMIVPVHGTAHQI